MYAAVDSALLSLAVTDAGTQRSCAAAFASSFATMFDNQSATVMAFPSDFLATPI